MSEADHDSEKGSALIGDNTDVGQEKAKAFDDKAGITDTKKHLILKSGRSVFKKLFFKSRTFDMNGGVVFHYMLIYLCKVILDVKIRASL